MPVLHTWLYVDVQPFGQCSRCHAVGTDDVSARDAAPHWTEGKGCFALYEIMWHLVRDAESTAVHDEVFVRGCLSGQSGLAQTAMVGFRYYICLHVI